MKALKSFITIWVELLGVYTVIMLLWQFIELLLIKEVNPNIIATFIGIVLTVILHYVYRKYIRV